MFNTAIVVTTLIKLNKIIYKFKETCKENITGNRYVIEHLRIIRNYLEGLKFYLSKPIELQSGLCIQEPSELEIYQQTNLSALLILIKECLEMIDRKTDLVDVAYTLNYSYKRRPFIFHRNS